MSTTIDTKVVEMRFDNKHFESNVSTTMSTLDKLKQKLNLSGATRGLDDVNAAVKKVDMSHLGTAVETVSAKFSAMQVVGVTALANITNSAVNTGKKLAKSLTIDQVTAGWNKYAQKTTSVQTIMNATGLSIEEVNQYLNRLMNFSDETSYGFTDMTSALATMTSSGGDIKKLIPMIMGVANATAYAGKGAGEFSRVMQYAVNQAYSLGYMQLMDWKTIQNANVNSKQLMETLIAAGEELGKIEKGQVTTANFTSTLADKWLDKEVMEKGFGRFSEFSEAVFDLMDAGQYDQPSDAIEALSGQYDDLSEKAFKAAQEAKTFTEAIDATKDTVSSGWMKTFEIIFGNYEDAKVIWTDLANVLWDIFASGAEGRNEFLSGAFDSNWDKIIKEVTAAGVATENLEKNIRKVVGEERLTSLIDEYGSLEGAIRSGSISSDELKAALDNVSKVENNGLIEYFSNFNEVVKRGATGESVKYLQALLDTFGYDLGSHGIDGSFGPDTEAAIKAFQKANGLQVDGIVGPETLKRVNELATEILEAEGRVDGLSDSCGELIDNLTKKSGRELLIEGLFNIIKAIQKPLSAVGKAFGEIFEVKSEGLYNVLEGFHRFTELIIIEKETAENLVDTFKGLFAILRIVSNILGGAVKIAFRAVTLILEKFDLGILDLTANIGRGLVEISNFIDTLIDAGLGAILDWIIPKIGDAIDAIGEWVASLKQTKIGSKVIGAFKDWPTTFGIITGAISNCVTAIGNWIIGLKDLEFFQHIGNVFKTAAAVVSGAIFLIADAIVNFNDSVIGQGLSTASSVISKWITELQETQLYKDVSQWFVNAGSVISGVFNTVKTAVLNFSMKDAIDNLTSMGSAIGSFFTGIWNSVKDNKVVGAFLNSFKSMYSGITRLGNVFKITNLDIGSFGTLLKDFVNIEDKAAALGSNPGAGIAAFFANIKDNIFAYNWNLAKENAMLKLAEFFTATGDKFLKAIDKIKEIGVKIKEFMFGTGDIDFKTIMEPIKSLLEIAVLLQAFKTLRSLTNPLDNITDGIDNVAKSLKWRAVGEMFKGMALALLAFAACLFIIKDIPFDTAMNGVITLGSILVVMAGTMVALTLVASKLNNALDMVSVAGTMFMLVGAVLLMMYALKQLDDFELKDPSKTFNMLGGILLSFALGVRMISAAGGASFKTVAAIATMLAAMKLLLEIIDAYDQYDWFGKSDAIMKMVGMLLVLATAINIASRGLKADASASGMAFMILAMVLSLKLILYAIEDIAKVNELDLLKGGVVITYLLGLIALLMVVSNLTYQGSTVLEKGQKSVNNFTGLASALLAVVAAIWLIAKMDTHTLVKGGLAVAAILSMFTVMLSSVGKACSGVKIGSVITIMVTIAILLAEMAIVVSILDDIPWQKSLASASAIGIIILTMASALKMLTKKPVKFGTIASWTLALIALGNMLSVMMLTLSLVGNSNPASLIAAGSAIALIITAMAGALLTLTKYDVYSGNIWHWVLAIGALSIIVGALSIVLYQMKSVPWDNSIGAATALSILLVTMAGAIGVITNTGKDINARVIWKWIAALGGMFAVVALLGATLMMSKDIPADNAIGYATAISILLVALTGVVTALAFLGDRVAKNGGGIATGIFALAALGLVVFELGAFLNVLRNGGLSGSDIGSVGVLSAMLATLTGVLAVVVLLGKIIGSNIANAIGPGAVIIGLALLAAVALEIGAFINILRNSGLSGSDIGIVTVLSAMLFALMPVLAIVVALGALVGVIGAATGGIGMGAAAIGMGIVLGAIALLAAVALEIGAFINILRNSGLSGSDIGIVTVLSAMLFAMTNVLAALGLIGILSIGSFGSIAALALLGLVVWEIGGIINNLRTNKLSGADIDLVKVLSTMLLTMTAVLVVLADLGWHAVGAIPAILVIALTIGLIIELIASLGELVEDTTELEGHIDKGMGVLVKIAGWLGKAVAAFMENASDCLPAIGEDLKAFAEKIDKFVKTMSLVDDKVATGSATLIKAVFGFLAADFAAGITRWRTGASLTSLGEDLSGFASKVGGFVTLMNDVDTDLAKSAESLSKAVLYFTAADFVQSITDVFSMFNGKGDLESFGDSISKFAHYIKYTAGIVKDLTDDDVASIKRAAEAGSAMSDLNEAIPNSDGMWQKWAGEKNLASWGKTICDFADSLIAFSDKVKGEAFDTAAVTSAADASMAMAKVNDAIPTTGGLWQQWTGEKKLADWGETLVDFGECLLAYNDIVTGQTFDSNAIKSSAVAADALADVNDKLSGTGGFWQDIAGEKDIGLFGTRLTSFATGLLDYCNVAVKIDDAKIEAIKNSGTAIDELALLVQKIPSSGGWGEAIFGGADIASFGDGLSCLADGIYNYTVSAGTIDEGDLERIRYSKKAIDELKLVVKAIPNVDVLEKAGALLSATENLKDLGSQIDALTELSYNYSGFGALKECINEISRLIGGGDASIDADTIYDNATSINSASTYLTKCATELEKLNERDYEGIGRFKEALVAISNLDIKAAINTLNASDGDLAEAVRNVANAISDNMGESLGNISDKIADTIKAFKDVFTDIGKGHAKVLAEGLKSEDSKLNLEAACEFVCTYIITALNSNYDPMATAGVYLGQGLISGIHAITDDVYWAAHAMGQAAVKGEKDGQQSNSPSKATIRAGKWLGEGLIIGINDMSSNVYKAGSSLGKTATSSLSSTISRISDAINTDIDSQPTIRPVLDLSDVQAGASSIGSMLNTANVGVMANVGTISNMMNRRSQNGSNDALIASIDKLRADMVTRPGDTYTINGVTYDDGSNIADAVKTIVRTAKIERRR